MSTESSPAAALDSPRIQSACSSKGQAGAWTQSSLLSLRSPLMHDALWEGRHWLAVWATSWVHASFLGWSGAVGLHRSHPAKSSRTSPAGVDGLQANEKEKTARAGEQPYGPSQRRRWIASTRGRALKAARSQLALPAFGCRLIPGPGAVRSACRLSWVPYGSKLSR
jgi:hypothetical protein